MRQNFNKEKDFLRLCVCVCHPPTPNTLRLPPPTLSPVQKLVSQNSWYSWFVPLPPPPPRPRPRGRNPRHRKSCFVDHHHNPFKIVQKTLYCIKLCFNTFFPAIIGDEQQHLRPNSWVSTDLVKNRGREHRPLVNFA